MVEAKQQRSFGEVIEMLKHEGTRLEAASIIMGRPVGSKDFGIMQYLIGPAFDPYSAYAQIRVEAAQEHQAKKPPVLSRPLTIGKHRIVF